MTERKLKLVKTEKRMVGRRTKAKQLAPRLVAAPVALTEAEAAEAARFRELVQARAARQAMLRRIIAELEDLDEMWPAA
ncbi:MAG: hypothetical protein AB1801_01230 [Chloroflexota bacterium]